MGFHDTDHDVLAAASAPERLAQHAKGFADARSVAEEKLENAACLLRGRGNLQPVFRLLWQRLIFSPAKTKAYARIEKCRDISPAGPLVSHSPLSLSPASRFSTAMSFL